MHRTKRRLWQMFALLGIVALMTAGPVAESQAKKHYHDYLNRPISYQSPSPRDSGGYDAVINLVTKAGAIHYKADFQAHGEKLRVWDRHTDGVRAQVQVRVYRHADADGVPYGIIDEDIFYVGDYQEFNLGTPDGSGNIAEGRWVGIRIRPERVTCYPEPGCPEWSYWAFGKA